MGKTRLEGRGRVVIPKELRKKLGLTPGTELEISARDGAIVIQAKEKLTSLTEFKGTITKDNAREKIDPLDVKNIWKT